LILLIIFAPSVARADCASPTGVAGKIIFDASSTYMQYCNGSNWVKFPKTEPASGWLQIEGGGEWNSPVSCGVTNDGNGWCWGSDTYGRLGNGAGITANQLTPSPIAGGYKWKHISVGETHACGLRTDGVAMCWGGNSDGMLGNGTWGPDQPAPVVVSGSHSWSQISAGRNHTCGLRTDGVTMCWGDDAYGRLGNGATGDVNTPGVVSGGYTWTHISAGEEHTCGITTSGAGYCWGRADSGRLGNGTTSPDVQTPSLVLGGHTWRIISSVTGGTSCGVTTSNVAYCWGSSWEGRLGNGTTTPNVSSPSLVSGSHQFRTIEIGIDAGCGITTANALYCWGSEAYGSGGFYGINSTPVNVSNGYSWASTGAGGMVRCGIRTDGVGMCWGRADTGALGNGTTTPNQYAPVLVGDATAACTLGTASTSTAYDTFQFRDIIFANGKFWALGYNGTYDFVMSSSDGITWSNPSNVGYFNNIAYGNGRYVAVQTYGTGVSMTSTDGVTWNLHGGATPVEVYNDIEYGNGTFIAAGRIGLIASTDGISWGAAINPGGEDWGGVAYGNGRFVAVALNWDCTNCAAVSTNNGASWTPNTGAGGDKFGLAFGKGLFVSVGAGGQIRTSPDGVTWTSRTSGSTAFLDAITYSNGRFMVAASNGIHLTSTDGITWTTVSGGATDMAWGGIAYGNGKFVAASTGSWSNDDTQRLLSIPCLGNCAGPTEPAGTIMYNGDRRVSQWCDGTNWHAMGPDNPGGASGGCSNPTGGAGKLIYNTDHRVMQYCDGGTWRAVGKVCDPIDCGLVHHWKLDETTVTAGSQIRDSAGNAHGTVTGTLTSVAGKDGRAVLFNADNEYIGGMGTLSALQNKTTFTFSAWMKRTATGSELLLGGGGTGANGSVYLDYYNSNIYWGVDDASGGYNNEVYTAQNDTNWHLMTLVFDGNLIGNNNRLKAFFDGVLLGSPTNLGTIPATSYSGTADFHIGLLASTYSRGTVDDVRIYNRALTAAEVLALYNATVDPCTVATPVPGASCADGTTYVGLSPDTNTKMYTTDTHGNTHQWGPSADLIANCTSVGGVPSTCRTGASNTATIAAAGAYPAADYCDALSVHGRTDWYLPALDELNLMYTVWASLPNTNTQYYWSSSQHNTTNGRYIDMNTGTASFALRTQTYHVRCVRKD
jgi:alpha-tubulin suppressor-like RCC1 family protein